MPDRTQPDDSDAPRPNRKRRGGSPDSAPPPPGTLDSIADDVQVTRPLGGFGSAGSKEHEFNQQTGTTARQIREESVAETPPPPAIPPPQGGDRSTTGPHRDRSKSSHVNRKKRRGS